MQDVKAPGMPRIFIRKGKGLIKKGAREFQKIMHSFDKNVIFSIGENCLTDDVLYRNNLKSFSSPYSSGRLNIEYILSFEKEDFLDFLNKEYLRYELYDDKKVVRNVKYVEVENKYHPSVINGFEFTHHDVLAEKRVYNTIQRRCERMKHLKRKNIIMVYHHRLCEDTDLELLITHISQVSNIYKQRGNTVHSFVFTQEIVSKEENRRVAKEVKNDIHFYKFFTLNEWCGDIYEIFWAKCDDDLIKEMIDDIRLCRL